MGFDAGRIHRGELIAAGGGVLLLAALFFLPWFAAGRPPASTGVPPVSLDGWQALTTIRWFLVLAIAASLALVLLTASQQAPAIPAAASMITCVLGILATVLVAFRVIHHPGLSARSGLFVGFVAALAAGYGGFVSLRAESSPFGDPDAIEIVPIDPARPEPEGRAESTSAGRTAP